MAASIATVAVMAASSVAAAAPPTSEPPWPENLEGDRHTPDSETDAAHHAWSARTWALSNADHPDVVEVLTAERAVWIMHFEGQPVTDRESPGWWYVLTIEPDETWHDYEIVTVLVPEPPDRGSSVHP